MKKLGIFLALTAAGVLGLADTASAQEDQPVNTIKSVGCPIDASTAGINPDGQCDGFEAVTPDEAGVRGYLCGVLDGMDADAAALGMPGDTTDLTDSIPPAKEQRDQCPGDDDDDDDDGSGKVDFSDGGAVTVQAQNATADGALPRTGGELFAGAGLVLMASGALFRRLLP